MNWYNTKIPIFVRKIRYKLTGKCECLLPFFKERWEVGDYPSFPMGRCCVCNSVDQIGEAINPTKTYAEMFPECCEPDIICDCGFSGDYDDFGWPEDTDAYCVCPNCCAKIEM